MERAGRGWHPFLEAAAARGPRGWAGGEGEGEQRERERESCGDGGGCELLEDSARRREGGPTVEWWRRKTTRGE